MEGSIMEFVKWFLYLLLMFMALALFMFFFQVGQTNRFEGFVTSQIERHGGLTPQAVENIEIENQNYYDGRYTVSIDEAGTSADVTYAQQDAADKYTEAGELSSDYIHEYGAHSVMNETLAYGDVLSYNVRAEYPILFGWSDPIAMTTSGQAIVQIRGSAGY